MLTWYCLRVLYSKYASQKENILSSRILSFYNGKKRLSCVLCFQVLYDILKLLMVYSARKKIYKEGMASKLGSRTTLYVVLAVRKLLDGSKKLEPREADLPSVGDTCGAFWYWQQTPTKTKERKILFWIPERTLKIYFSPENYWKFSEREVWEKDQCMENIASVGDT